MAPGFVFVLLSVLLAALAPVVLLISVAFCFSTTHRPQALQWLRSGVVGGVAVVGVFFLLAGLIAPAQPQAQPEVSFVLFGAGFSAFVISRVVFPLLRNRWQDKQ